MDVKTLKFFDDKNYCIIAINSQVLFMEIDPDAEEILERRHKIVN
jgi:hypothetical protein